MRLINSILALIVGCALTGCATGRVDHHILKGDGSYNHVITNPKEWALQQFSDGPISGSDVSDYAKLILKRGLLQTLADLGADGTKELFSGRTVRPECGRCWSSVPPRGGIATLATSLQEPSCSRMNTRQFWCTNRAVATTGTSRPIGTMVRNSCAPQCRRSPVVTVHLKKITKKW